MYLRAGKAAGQTDICKIQFSGISDLHLITDGLPCFHFFILCSYRQLHIRLSSLHVQHRRDPLCDHQSFPVFFCQEKGSRTGTILLEGFLLGHWITAFLCRKTIFLTQDQRDPEKDLILPVLLHAQHAFQLCDLCSFTALAPYRNLLCRHIFRDRIRFRNKILRNIRDQRQFLDFLRLTFLFVTYIFFSGRRSFRCERTRFLLLFILRLYCFPGCQLLHVLISFLHFYSASFHDLIHRQFLFCLLFLLPVIPILWQFLFCLFFLLQVILRQLLFYLFFLLHRWIFNLLKFIVPLLIFLLILRKPFPGQPFIQAADPDPKFHLSGFSVLPEHALIDKRCLSRQKICSQSQLRFYCSPQHGSCQHCHNSGFLHLFPYSVFHRSSSFLPALAFLIHMIFLQELTFPQTKASLPGKWCMISVFSIK